MKMLKFITTISAWKTKSRSNSHPSRSMRCLNLHFPNPQLDEHHCFHTKRFKKIKYGASGKRERQWCWKGNQSSLIQSTATHAVWVTRPHASSCPRCMPCRLPVQREWEQTVPWAKTEMPPGAFTLAPVRLPRRARGALESFDPECACVRR